VRAQPIEHSRCFADASRPELLHEVQMALQGFGRICAPSELLQVISLILKQEALNPSASFDTAA
jgi:hypothetical protein